MKRLFFASAYSDTKSNFAAFMPNALTIIVGANGYGKTSFIQALEEHLKHIGVEYVTWSDNANGRSNGMSEFLWNNNFEGLAAMAFHSEGQSMIASFGYKCIRLIGSKVRKNKDMKELFILIDQLDSGLDVYMINDVKNTFKNTIIPDMNKRGITAYIVITANSYELVKGEYCFDPVSREQVIFNSYKDFYNYISAQHKE